MNANIFAVGVFCIVAFVGVAGSLVATVLLGLYFNAFSIWGSSHSPLELLFNLLMFVLWILSIVVAYVLAKKTHRAVLRQGIAQEIEATGVQTCCAVVTSQTIVPKAIHDPVPMAFTTDRGEKP